MVTHKQHVLVKSVYRKQLFALLTKSITKQSYLATRLYLTVDRRCMIHKSCSICLPSISIHIWHLFTESQNRSKSLSNYLISTLDVILEFNQSEENTNLKFGILLWYITKSETWDLPPSKAAEALSVHAHAACTCSGGFRVRWWEVLRHTIWHLCTKSQSQSLIWYGHKSFIKNILYFSNFLIKKEFKSKRSCNVEPGTIHQTPCSIMAVFLLNNTIDTFDTNRHTSLSI